MAHALQPTYHGGTDGFAAKINASGNELVYATYLGGSAEDMATGIAADSDGNAYVAGFTSSTDFPTLKAIQPANHGGRDAFLTSISRDGGKLLSSTYLGGSADEGQWSDVHVVVGSTGGIYLAGATASSDFPTTPLGFQRVPKGNLDAFVAKIAMQSFLGVSRRISAFGPEAVGHSSIPQKLVLANNGASPLTINNIYVAGADAADFAQTTNCSRIAVGATCRILVTFAPSATGTRKGVLAISDSDPASPHVIALAGSGKLTVVHHSPTGLSFDDQPVATASSPKTVIVTNLARRPLNFTAIGITGTDAGDFIQANTCGARIAAGATCKIKVTFMPTAIRSRKATLTIDDDGGASPQKVPLSGTGT